MEEGLPSPFIKKRSKVRPSGSTSSLRTLAASPAPSTSTLSFANDEGDDDDDAGNVAVVRARGKKTPAGRVKDREGSGKPKGGRLSFGAAAAEDEEEGDSTFTVKRSESARRLLRPTDSTATPSLLREDGLPANLDKASISDTSSTPAKSIYSKEYLNQLKADTLSTPPPSREGEYDELTKSKFGAVLEDTSGNIPTMAAIAEAKERRERIRAQGGGTGSDAAFISLEVGMPNKRGESRLVREEDEIGDGDEDLADFTGAKESVPLGQKANKEAAAKMRSGMVEMIQDAEEDEEDEEMRDWENAQIRRGEQRREETIKTSSANRPYKPTPIPHTAALPSMSGVSTRLSTALKTLETSHTMDSAALDHFAHERAELDAQENELRAEVERVEQKNRWFSDFKSFIEEIAAFLDEKHPLLEKIESENLAIQKERYDIVSRRRYEDDSDDVALFTGASIPSTYFLIPSEEPNPEPEVDELGRTRPDDTAPRSAVRTARRSDREKRIAKRPKLDEDESAWTDDDLGEGDSADLSDALSSLREKLTEVFSDVKAADFRDPNLGIRKKFEEWREKYNEEYENAFGGLALVGVWEFWARVEMALWNPFEIAQLAKTPPGLDAYRWHACLSEYGHSGAQADDEEDGLGERPYESEIVVNGLVSAVVIPRLEKLAKETFDPMSRKQTARALAVLDEVSYSVEKTSPKFENLIRAFLARFQLTITQSQSLILPHLTSISLPQNAFDPSLINSRNRFANRQYKLLLNALRWRRFGRGVRLVVTGEGGEGGMGVSLDELIVRELVAKVILPIVEAGWQTGGDEIGRKVLAVLPAGDFVPPALRERLEGGR